MLRNMTKFYHHHQWANQFKISSNKNYPLPDTERCCAIIRVTPVVLAFQTLGIL